MRRAAGTRQGRADLLPRRPRIDRTAAFIAANPVSRVDQFRALIRLYDRGVLTTREFEQQGTRIFDSRA